MKLPKIRELVEAIKAVLSGPDTNQFPFKKIIPPDGFRGKPQYYEEDCVGCRACLEVCPARAIDCVDDRENKKRTLTHHQDQCVYCGQCEKACITEKGIKLTKEFDLSTDDRSKSITTSLKELVLCGNCGEIIGALEHLVFLSKKVGPLLYANPTLLMARKKELALLPSDFPHKRAGHLAILCPNCRREMIVKEQF